MSLQLIVFDALLRLTAKRRFARNPDVLQLREMMASMKPARIPARLSLEETRLNGVRTEKIPRADPIPKRALLYTHGGALAGGAPPNHRALIGRLAAQLNVPANGFEYRLAPEPPFPAGLDDC